MKEFIEKLINRLEEYRYNTGESIINLGERKAIYKISNIIDELAEEYSENTTQKSAGGWIPVTERLPDNNQLVIFTDTDGEVEAGIYDANKNWCVNDSYFPNAFNFVAWQPLPEPYEAEKTSEWKDAVMNHFTKIE